MPSAFDITVASNTVVLDSSRQGVAVFTVKNNARRRVRASAQVTTAPPDAETWLTILLPDGGSTDTANTRDFPIDGTQQFQVRVVVPPDAAPASYVVRLTVADQIDPDDNFTTSPDVQFTVRDLPKPAPRPFPMWIIPAVVIALVVIGVIIVVAVTASNNASASATATAVALLGARNLADTATASASLNGTATAVAQMSSQQQTQIAQTQTALNVLIGRWIPSGTAGSIPLIVIEDAGANTVNITIESYCPPSGTVCNNSPALYSIMGVPFNPQQLVAGLGNITLLIQPANNGQIVVTASVAGFTNLFTYQRAPAAAAPRPAPLMVATSVNISPLQLNQLMQFTPSSP